MKKPGLASLCICYVLGGAAAGCSPDSARLMNYAVGDADDAPTAQDARDAPVDASTPQPDASDATLGVDVRTGVDAGPAADVAPDAPLIDASTTLPDPPTLPEPFQLDCPAATLSDAALQSLQDNEYCVGQGSALFEDATAASGAGHIHQFAPGLRFYERQAGGGVVLEDLNNDGWLDLYVSSADSANRLLLNDGAGQFLDCTAQTGLGFADDWTNGVSAADYDNDGWQDLYLANYGRDRLLHNNGDGTFTDVTDAAGITAADNSSTASWGDLDGDGRLDLLVAGVVTQFAFNPSDFEPGVNRLYRNMGNGSFEERTDQAGLVGGSTFVAPLLDFDNDGDLDILVPQEFHTYQSGQLLRNDGPAASGWVDFTNTYTYAEVPLSTAAMGLAAVDVNADARVDLAIANLWGWAPNRETLLVNRGDLTFVDEAPDRNATAMSTSLRGDQPLRLVSWSIVPIDVENDRDEDLLYAYGHFSPGSNFDTTPDEYAPLTPGQPNALMANDGTGTFTMLAGTCAEDTGQARGAVAGDIDKDGCLDLYVVNQEGSSRLLRNRCEQPGNHLTIDLVGTTSNRDAVGARVAVTAGGVTQHKRVTAGSTTLHSAAPKALHFGLGDAAVVDRIDIWWPSGVRQAFANVTAGSLVLEEPAGR